MRVSPPRPPAVAVRRSAASSPSLDGSPTLVRPPPGRRPADVAASPGPARRLICAGDSDGASTPTTRRKERPADSGPEGRNDQPPAGAGAGAGLFGALLEGVQSRPPAHPHPAAARERADGTAESSDAGSRVESSLPTPAADGQADETLDANAIMPAGSGGGFSGAPPAGEEEEPHTAVYCPQEPIASQAVGSGTPPEPRYHLLTHMPAETLDFFDPAAALAALADAAGAAAAVRNPTPAHGARQPAVPAGGVADAAAGLGTAAAARAAGAGDDDARPWPGAAARDVPRPGDAAKVQAPTRWDPCCGLGGPARRRKLHMEEEAESLRRWRVKECARQTGSVGGGAGPCCVLSGSELRFAVFAGSAARCCILAWCSSRIPRVGRRGRHRRAVSSAWLTAAVAVPLSRRSLLNLRGRVGRARPSSTCLFMGPSGGHRGCSLPTRSASLCLGLHCIPSASAPR